MTKKKTDKDKDKDKEFIPQKEKPKNNVNDFNRQILEKEKNIDKEFIVKNFKYQDLIAMLKVLNRAKKIKMIKSGLIDLKNESKKKRCLKTKKD